MAHSMTLWAAFLAVAQALSVEPALQALSWRYNGTDFWAPTNLESSVYRVHGVSLNRREQQRGGHIGCTVITIHESAECLSSAVLEEALASFASDDVWSAEQFMECMVVQRSEDTSGIPVDSSLETFLSSHDVTTTFISSSFNLNGSAPAGVQNFESPSYPDGPYVGTIPSCEDGDMSLTPVYTLHPDDYQAFMHGSFKDENDPDKHQQLHVSLPGSHALHIIVPSRLSAPNGPLSGLRFAVKDIFHINGLRTSGGSRSYYQAFGPQNYTTETVQLTLDAGASLIGKTKTIAFALGAPINGMEVDYQDPWNSRGDGYLSTGGSSTGSGAAVTAYEWVDFTIGSDTGGSVRFPARFGGVYGYKPTHGIFSLTGILPAIAEQDTPGILARSPEVFTRVGRVWAEGKPLAPAPSRFPSKLLQYADQITEITQPEVEVMVEAFVADLAAALDMETISINMTESFLASNVSRTDPPQDMAEFMATVYSDQNSVQCWDEIGVPLAEAYGKIPGREGAFPPADPPVNASWTNGRDPETRARYPESQRRRVAFGEWFNKEVLPTNETSCSEYIFAHTYHVPPDTVKVDPAKVELFGGWGDGVYSNYAGVPEIVVPIGQVEYWSAYTQRLEWQPVTMALGAAKGCDLMLFELVDRLVEEGLLREVMAGKIAYPVDE